MVASVDEKNVDELGLPDFWSYGVDKKRKTDFSDTKKRLFLNI